MPAIGRKKVYAAGTMTVADVFAVVKQTIIDAGFNPNINESTPGDARDLLDFSYPISRTGMEEDAPHFVIYLQHDSEGPGSGVDSFQVATVWGASVDDPGAIAVPSVNWVGGPGYAHAMQGPVDSATGTYTLWAYANDATGHWWFMLTVEEELTPTVPGLIGFAGGFLSRRPHDEREPGVCPRSILCLNGGEAYTAFILGTDGNNIATPPYLDLVTPIGYLGQRKQLNTTTPAATPKRIVNIFPVESSGNEFAPGIIFGELDGFMWATDGFDNESYPLPFMICLNTIPGSFVLEATETFSVLT